MKLKIEILVVLFIAYVVMAFSDGIGVMAARLDMGDAVSALVYPWFALLPILAAKLCGKTGNCKAVAISLATELPACVLLYFGATRSFLVAIGFAFVGISNVLLQTTLPAWIAELYGVGRLSGVIMAGLSVKTAMAISLPFAIVALATYGNWKMVFIFFAVVTVLSIFLALRIDSDNGKNSLPSTAPTISLGALITLLKDHTTILATLALPVAIVADIAFNISVPTTVTRRFAGDDVSIGIAYAVLFGVKLLVMLIGSMCFVKRGVKPYILPSVSAAVAGTVIMLASGTFAGYLVGVALFAFGYANVYGFVFEAAVQRHQDAVPSVAALLTMFVSGGALASPLVCAVSPYGLRSSDALVLVFTVALAVLLVMMRRKMV